MQTIKIALLELAAENAFQNGDTHLTSALYDELEKVSAESPEAYFRKHHRCPKGFKRDISKQKCVSAEAIAKVKQKKVDDKKKKEEAVLKGKKRQEQAKKKKKKMLTETVEQQRARYRREGYPY